MCETNVSNVVLTHCHSAWGLPTYDPRCLEIMLFLHLCKVKWQAIESNYAYSPHSGCYPHFRVDNEVAGAEWYPNLLAKLKPDCELKPLDKVLVSYVRKRLNLVNDFCFWSDEDNKVHFANEFKSRLSIFYHFKSYHFNSRKSEVHSALEKNNIRSREAAMDVLWECLELLEARLAKSVDNTFSNRGLSLLDCAVGAQLLVMKYHKLPTRYTKLEETCILEEYYPNLNEFLKRIHTTTEEMMEKLKPGEEKLEEREVTRIDRPPRRETSTKEKSREEQEADQKSRMFLMGCLLTVVAYCYIFKPIQVEVEPD